MEAGITVPFLEGILTQKIDFLKIGAGSNVGDNYTSIMTSIEVTLHKDPTEPLHLLLKTYPTHPARQQFLEDTDLFRKELFVYNTLLPDLVTFADDLLTSKKGQEEELKLAFPPLVHGKATKNSNDASPSELANYLLMVDLRKTWGYKMADRFQGLDVAHCRLLMKELAKFHALGWCYKVKVEAKGQKLRDLYPFLRESIFLPEKRDLMDMMLDQGFNVMGSMLEDKLGKDSEVCQGFQRLRNDATETMLLYLDEEVDIPEEIVASRMRVKPESTAATNPSPWRVICHGDCWANNFLFLYDTVQVSVPLKIMLVDLQLLREVCPTTDLAYFFYSSTTHDLRQGHLDSLLDLYAEHFQRYCALLGGSPLPGFSSAELKRRFHRSKLFGCLIATMIMPLILRPPESMKDLDTLDTGEAEQSLQQMLTAMQDTPYDNERISSRIVAMAQELYDQGII